MEAKEVGNELKRMFKSLGGEPNERSLCDGVTCSECPFNVKEQSLGLARCILNFTDIDEVDEVIDVVIAWSAEHPKETNKEVFLKVFPNAQLNSYGLPASCAHLLGLVSHCDGHTSCAECWNEEYKGADVERLRGEAE